MTTPNTDAFKNEDDVRRFIKKNRIGFSPEEMLAALKRPPTEFQNSPDNPWVQLKKEQEERGEE